MVFFVILAIYVTLLSDQAKHHRRHWRTADVVKNVGLAMPIGAGDFQPSSAVFRRPQNHDFYREVVVFG
jgi:hypothetical protein